MHNFLKLLTSNDLGLKTWAENWHKDYSHPGECSHRLCFFSMLSCLNYFPWFTIMLHKNNSGNNKWILQRFQYWLTIATIKWAYIYLQSYNNNYIVICKASGWPVRHLDDQPITPCHGTLMVVADDEVGQRRLGGPHLKKIWWTEESIGTASGLWLQTEADSELLLPIVLSRTRGSKC